MLRKFIKEGIKACTDCSVTANRLTRSILLDYEYELNDPTSEFSMKAKDFENPKGRTEHAFLGKHLKQVDTEKMERVEAYVNLLALRGYKEKYNTDRFDTVIEDIEIEIESKAIVEVDSLASEITTSSSW